MKNTKKILLYTLPLLIIAIALSTIIKFKLTKKHPPVLAKQNNGFHATSINKVLDKPNTLQVNGYFYNHGTKAFWNVRYVIVVVKDVNGKAISGTFCDNALARLLVNPSVKVKWSFYLSLRKDKNWKHYNFSKWSCDTSYDYSY